MTRIRTLTTPTAIVLAVLMVDQATKAIARTSLPLCLRHGCAGVELPGPLGFHRILNEGSAFGSVQGSWLWLVVAVVGTALAPWLARRGAGSGAAIGAALLVAGGLGNLVDRALFGGVTDFIDGGTVLFNIADVVLTVGAVMLSVSLSRGSFRAVPANAALNP
jgi:signal peptidase II